MFVRDAVASGQIRQEFDSDRRSHSIFLYTRRESLQPPDSSHVLSVSHNFGEDSLGHASSLAGDIARHSDTQNNGLVPRIHYSHTQEEAMSRCGRGFWRQLSELHIA